MPNHPQTRLRRLRQNPTLRKMIQETRLSVDDLIYPIFVTHGKKVKREIEQMPGVFQLSIDNLASEVKEIVDLGIPATLLFGIPSTKDPVGMGAYDSNGIIQEAVREIKKNSPQLLVITDVCLCEYTDHGHCGVIVNDNVDNDHTLELLAKIGVSHAHAGADIVAPSAMMDGQVAAIRSALNDERLENTPIMSYSAKYASAFYGPFRTAASSVPQFGDRRGYQIDPPNVLQALEEIKQDIEEGADLVMVKPALAYLDIIIKAKETYTCPIVAYNVSGEYSMVKAVRQNKWLDDRQVTIEIITAIKRAGADIVISYHSKELAQWLAASD